VRGTAYCAAIMRKRLEQLRGRYEDAGQLTAMYDAWDAKGPETKSALLRLLPDDWSFEGKRVLDFGCGTGRTLRHFLPEAETGEFWGTDIDAGYIREAQEALCPPMHAMRCEVAPPLGMEYGSFDLAWAISVFTHLTDNSIPWLLELHRLLKPGGLLIATYIGRWNSEYAAGEPWNEDLVGMNVLQHTMAWDRGGPTVLMSDWWVRAHWGRPFEILDVESNVHNMSWVLLRKRDVELTTEDLERPEDDPREYLAVRHNLERVRRELEFAGAVCEKLVEDTRRDVRREYERSLSWRVTRPLREAAGMARSFRARRSR
jgi:SAM-dependent methyltransferase